MYVGPELFETVAEFAESYPQVQISTMSGTHEELYNGLVSGESGAKEDRSPTPPSEYVPEMSKEEMRAEFERQWDLEKERKEKSEASGSGSSGVASA